MQIERLPLEHVTPPSWNARTGHNVKGIAHSITTHGMLDPIGIWAVSDGESLDPPYLIVEGSGRFYAVTELGHADIPTIAHDFPDEMAAQAYAINHNLQTDESEFDDSRLEATLSGLDARERLHEAGYDGSALAELRERLDAREPDAELNTDPDDTPSTENASITQVGDVWICGNHRIMCGDATDADTVAVLFAGAEPGMTVTDPPYGVDYDPEWRAREAEKGNLAYAASRVGIVANDDRADWSEAWALCPGAVIYAWSPAMGTNCIETGLALRNAGYEIRYMLIWSKPHFPIGRGHYHWRHEPCWYAVRAGETAGWVGDRKQTTVWEIALDKNVDGGHSTQKPVECMARAIRNHSHAEIYDPFVGSGTTIIACEQLRRTCYAMEIEPRYVEVSVRRWMLATGERAVREGDGFEFPADDEQEPAA